MSDKLPHGKVCYLEISTDDLAKSAAFYQALFGWKTRASDCLRGSEFDRKEILQKFEVFPCKMSIWRRKRLSATSGFVARSYRYWRGRPDGDVFDAIAVMSEEAYASWYAMKGITPHAEGSPRSLTRIQRIPR